MANGSDTKDRRRRLVLREGSPPSEEPHEAFARTVAEGLGRTPKDLSALSGHDPQAAGLLDEIAELPDYYLARAERQILTSHAAGIAARFRKEPPVLVELGAGDAGMVRILIAALLTRHGRLRHVTIGQRREALVERACALLDEYPRLEATCLVSDPARGLRESRKLDERPHAIVWLGSAIGAFDRVEAANELRVIGETMRTSDVLLVGIDLRKDARTLERAYNDSSRLMARKSLGVLTRINRELGADFDTSRFRHRATFAEEAGRVELHVVSRRRQVVTIGDLELETTFGKGETILTEVAYKYSPSEIDAAAEAAGLVVQDRWYDRDGRFSMNLLRHVPRRR